MIPTRRICEILWDELGISQELKGHLAAVAECSVTIGRALNKKGYSLNIPLIEAAALLHDIKKGAPHHAAAGADLLRALGFSEAAPIVEAHMRLPYGFRPEINELTVVFLSDKLFIENQFVSPETRYSEKMLACRDNPVVLRIISNQLNLALNLKTKVENALGTGIFELYKGSGRVMKLIKTTEAVGHVLCHDITQIIPGEKKEAVFRKGHIVTEEDIPVLLSIGKDHLYIWEMQEGMLHENDAAAVLYSICKNEGMSGTPVKEGKIELVADIDGLFKVDVTRLNRINALGEMMIATRHTNFPVKKGDRLAGTRIIPLTIEKIKMDRAKEIAGGVPLLALLPFKNRKAAIITTGNEVFYGRIKDAFGPVIRDKLSKFNVQVLGQTIINDEKEKITRIIKDYIEKGADLIICTGGMSVDPDDTTPSAIKDTGARLVSYGAPVLPGAMFLLAYLGGQDIPVMGLPGCVMYSRSTIFDLVLPRIMAGEILKAEDLSVYGHGGLCLNCPDCYFPNCGFGK